MPIRDTKIESNTRDECMVLAMVDKLVVVSTESLDVIEFYLPFSYHKDFV